ncbi:MAG: leucine-rich repeat protein, partial [Clostridia bacterium]|nr:leucine-rich repeat protein [Clostridia bacterium]
MYIKRIIALIMSLMLCGTAAYAEEAARTEQTLESEQTAEVQAEKDKYGETYYVTDADGEKRVRFKYDVIDGAATITDAHVYKEETDLVFPSEIEGYPVKRVENVTMERADEVTYEEDGATFTNKANMRVKSVRFEDGIESLSRVDFTECREMESVYIADSVKEIDRARFSHCPKLGAVHMPENAARCDISFERCYAIEQLRFPKGIKEIPEYCCFMCTSLESVTLPEGLEVIGKRAFNSCIVLDIINVPNSVTVIGDYAFCGCKALKTVKLPKRLEEINEGVFAGSGITSVELPAGIKTIGVKAFYETAIEEVKIPSSVKRIDRNAFGMCRNLLSITISANTKPEIYAFSGCHNLSDVTVDGGMTREIFEAMLGANVNEAAPCVKKYFDEYDGDFVIFDGHYLAKYKGTDRNPVIPEGVTELGAQAFREADIDSVTFPSTKIAEIPAHCFQGSKIKEITIPSTVGKIKEMAFYGCYDLARLTIEDGVESVQDSAFINCYSLGKSSVNIGKKVRVSKNAFRQTPLDEEFTDGGGVAWRRSSDDVMEVPFKHAMRNELKEAQSFTDMEDSAESTLLQRLGAISGYGDGTFRPQNDVTRAEAVKIILNAIGYSDENIAEFGLDYASGSQEETIRRCADYNPNHWGNAYMQRAVDMGIISGFEDGTLRPDDNVTVEQLYTMLVNITGYGGYAKKDGYPSGYIRQAQAACIDKDMIITKYDKNATRLETMKAVFNAINAPVCVVKNETRQWDGTLVPEYEIKNGTGKDYRTLLTYNFWIYPVEAEVTEVSADSVTVSIYGAPNFGGKAIAQRSGKTAALKTDMADRLE